MWSTQRYDRTLPSTPNSSPLDRGARDSPQLGRRTSSNAEVAKSASSTASVTSRSPRGRRWWPNSSNEPNRIPPTCWEARPTSAAACAKPGQRPRTAFTSATSTGSPVATASTRHHLRNSGGPRSRRRRIHDPTERAASTARSASTFSCRWPKRSSPTAPTARMSCGFGSSRTIRPTPGPSWIGRTPPFRRDVRPAAGCRH
jgi:hypothetical protein